MAAPFIVIRTFTIKEGKFEAFKQFLREFFKIISIKEPVPQRGVFRATKWPVRAGPKAGDQIRHLMIVARLITKCDADG